MLLDQEELQQQRQRPILRDSVLEMSIAETSFNTSKPPTPDGKRAGFNQFSTFGNPKFNLSDLETAGSFVSQGSVPVIKTCGIQGCTALAIGGKCDFSICFTNGCNMALCNEHTAKSENSDEDGLTGHVCTECQPRVDRVTMFWLIILIGIPILLSLPAVFLYSTQTGDL